MNCAVIFTEARLFIKVHEFFLVDHRTTFIVLEFGCVDHTSVSMRNFIRVDSEMVWFQISHFSIWTCKIPLFEVEWNHRALNRIHSHVGNTQSPKIRFYRKVPVNSVAKSVNKNDGKTNECNKEKESPHFF